MQKNKYQAELFKNRLQKRFKHLSKWARREGVFAYRLYDKDIPEIPLAVDIYFAEENCIINSSAEKKAFLLIYLYKRPYEKSQEEEKEWLLEIEEAAASSLSIPKERIFTKLREKQKGKNQYEKVNSSKNLMSVKEGECLFYINVEDYLDSGLFLDHRPARSMIFKEAKNKKVLNLFSYTGSFSVHAAKGGAASVDSVDLSNTYLNWAKENLKLNKLFDEEKTRLIKSDVIRFLEKAIEEKKEWDLIICDPPTFSNSKSADVFDVNKDWLKLCLLCLDVLSKNGRFYFSTNSQKIKFDEAELINSSPKKIRVRDITKTSIPEDFRNQKIHKMWMIEEDK
ncbi:class I SAM-dependent methyltransferase [Treponema sp. OMZ 792]|uniref:class I SAM-dependent methyltransferase n=1 Tax=unclassified Treponema TaxID=2638727 RepID=UPI0020A2D071|nr:MULTISPECIES: class I SAM-dependent methyltransferase [unclassified Treponema]UTC75893.1 class I SAM-dependent methyltransferase [Treponema sp. OMZ 792]UTC79893.1 methyltransferase [Treponema sp. OMZ 798]